MPTEKKERQQMKARIPLPNDLKSAVKTEIEAEWKKIQLGKRIFLTHEEAEQALKEREENETT